MTISAARVDELLHGQTAIARKVYEVVPLQDAWTSGQISGALTQQTRSSIQFRTLEGCLRTLRDAGLVYEPKPNYYQRVTPRERLKAVPTPKTIPEPAAPIGAAELLGELAMRTRQLADDIQAAAEVITEQQASNEEAQAKLSQLQALLKSLA